VVRFYGYVSSPKQLANLIKGAKLFVLPSYTEGLPRAMLESMFLGVPVLVSPVGGIKYVIRDCENGFLVQSGVPRELARRIREILEQIETGKYDLLIRTAQIEAGAYTFSARAKYFLDRSVNRSN